MNTSLIVQDKDENEVGVILLPSCVILVTVIYIAIENSTRMVTCNAKKHQKLKVLLSYVKVVEMKFKFDTITYLKKYIKILFI